MNTNKYMWLKIGITNAVKKIEIVKYYIFYRIIFAFLFYHDFC